MRAGDERALGGLFDRYATLVYREVRRTIGDADDAEEVVEDTFWQAWRQADRFDAGRGGVSTWLVMIARSRALDRARRQRLVQARTERLADGETDQMEDDVQPSPLDHAEGEERRRRVAETLAKLPAEQRLAVELAYFEGMSQSQIAAATAEPLGTVKTRVRLAMQKLRTGLSALQEVTAS
jgi:RNA polymerase sigma-70 factor (ECF subfamily)